MELTQQQRFEKWAYMAGFDIAKHEGEIVLEHINTIYFPLDRLDWLIECLQRIKAELLRKR